MVKQCLFILCTLAVLCLPAQADEVFRIGIGQSAAGYPDVEQFKDVLREGYARIGKTVRFARGPLARDLEDTCTHNADASAFRTPDGVRFRDNIVQVPVLLFTVSFVCFFERLSSPIRSWDDLNGLKAGYISGVRVVRLEAAAHGLSLIPVKTFAQGFRMLESGRLDVFIAEDLFGGEIASRQLEGAVRMSQPLFTADVFHYVNRGHADLVAPLAAAFREMFRDGTMKRLFGKYASMLSREPGKTPVLSPNEKPATAAPPEASQ